MYLIYLIYLIYPGPAECAKRSAAPACRAWRARLISLAQSSCLRSAVPILPVLAQLGLIWAWLDPCPLLNPPQPGPTFRQAVSFGCSPALLERTFFASFLRPRFLSIFSPFWAPFGLPKSSQNWQKSEKMGLQAQLYFLIVFLSLLLNRF